MEHSATRIGQQCLSDEVLRDFVAGRIQDPAVEEQLADHLASCEFCDTRLQQLPRDTLVDLLCQSDSLEHGVAPSKSAVERSLDTTSTKSLRPDESKVEPKDLPGTVDADAGELPVNCGNYFVVRELGSGGFGQVYLARDPIHSRLVAVKVPRPDRLHTPASRQAFLAEARTVAELDHRHIVPMYDCCELQDGRCLVAMKYVEGRDLRELMQSERIEPSRAADIVASIAAALDYAHRRKIFHRDVKPANVLLDSDGTPYLTDFGLALHVDRQQHHVGELAGTYPYMSPEQILRRANHLDGRSDIWSLGVILFELLTRQRPFTGSTYEVLKEEILCKPARPLRTLDATIPRELEDICLKCLSKQVEQRYATAGDLAADLKNWLQTQGIERVAGAEAPRNRGQESLAVETRSPPRRLSAPARWTVVGLCLLALAALSWTIHSVMSRGRLFDDRSPIVDQVAEVGVPFPLLAHEPSKLLWSPDDDPKSFDYDEQRSKLLLNSRALRLVELNRTMASNFDLQVTLQKPGSTEGAAGIFWAFTQTQDELGRVTAKCQAVFVSYDAEQQAFLLLRRSLKFERLEAEYPDIHVTTYWDHTIPHPSGSNCTLELRVRDAKVQGISLDRLPVPSDELADKNYSLERQSAAGAFGVFNELGVTEFIGDGTTFTLLKESAHE